MSKQNFPFTDQEIQELEMSRKPSELWHKAFMYHNKYSGNKPLGMGCASCFAKVLTYLKSVKNAN